MPFPIHSIAIFYRRKYAPIQEQIENRQRLVDSLARDIINSSGEKFTQAWSKASELNLAEAVIEKLASINR